MSVKSRLIECSVEESTDPGSLGQFKSDGISVTGSEFIDVTGHPRISLEPNKCGLNDLNRKVYDEDNVCYMVALRSVEKSVSSLVIDAVSSTCDEVSIDMTRVTLDDE